MCVCFHPSLIELQRSRKCVRHEIHPGYLLSHAPARRLPSNSAKPPSVRGVDAQLAHAQNHTQDTQHAANTHATDTSREQGGATLSAYYQARRHK